MTQPTEALRELAGDWVEEAPANRPVEEASGKPMRCGLVDAMTIDVEDYFQVEAFASTIDRSDWESLPRRVERNTERLLQPFARQLPKCFGRLPHSRSLWK